MISVRASRPSVSNFSSGENPSLFGYELMFDVAVEKLQEFSGTAAEYIVLAMQKTTTDGKAFFCKCS